MARCRARTPFLHARGGCRVDDVRRLEVPVKRILLGEAADTVTSRGSLVDPTALDWFAELGRDA